MGEAFVGFSAKAMTFLRRLEKNNRREWFQPRKPVFEAELRGPMMRFVELLNEDLSRFAVDHVTQPARAIYRIYRDTRFSKDKTPYKTHIGALFPRAGLTKNGGAGFYVGVSHKGLEIAGGMYMPTPAELAAVRTAIRKNPGEMRKLTQSVKLVKQLGPLAGVQLKRTPKGVAPDDPAADLLRFKQFYHFVTLPAAVAQAAGIRREVVGRFKLLSPLVNHLNEIALSAAAAEPGESGRPTRPAPMF